VVIIIIMRIEPRRTWTFGLFEPLHSLISFYSWWSSSLWWTL